MSHAAATMTRTGRNTLVRMNGTCFHAVVIASFLESVAPDAAKRMFRHSESGQSAARWVDEVWLPSRSVRSTQLRERVAMIWPEFDWAEARSRFRQEYWWVLSGGRQYTTASSLFDLSLAAAHAAIFYRMLGAWSDDHEIRRIATDAASEELRHFAWLQRSYNDCDRRDRMSFWDAAVRARATQHRWRDHSVRLAFESIAAGWTGPAVVSEVSYPSLLAAIASAAGRTQGAGLMRRLLLRPWQMPPASAKGTGNVVVFADAHRYRSTAITA